MGSVFEEVIANQPLVLDNGTGIIKTGFAGDDAPKALCPSFVGRPKHKRVMAGAAEGDVFVGPKAEALRGLLRLSYPMRHGIVQDWLDMELLWAYVFSDLKVNSEEHPVLLTESVLNPRRQREKAAEIFFESFNSPALFVSAQPILALYSSGRTTGLVLDCGEGVSHAVPVIEGFALSHAITRADVAGRDITEYLAVLLRRAGYIFHTSAEYEVVRQIKEQACYVAFNPQKEEAASFEKSGGGYPFQLPDGTAVSVGSERYRAPEILFHPSLIGLEYPGVHELIGTSISRADLDLRRTLYSQLVLAGGSTYFHGFGDRLLNEVRKIAPKDIKIRISAPPERKISTWIGGSILASLSTFKKMWVAKQEYEESGASILHRKTL
ncbi:alpha-centractin [Cyclospora cayetanensis]|uniref:Alpha-centractin n=1 Tax=Cyclospora cayetanensis TaxID=88456 RepID=A0A6P6RXE2_9EIME|nr:alpha-centractin [Cyclospora cayetanensis]